MSTHISTKGRVGEEEWGPDARHDNLQLFSLPTRQNLCHYGCDKVSTASIAPMRYFPTLGRRIYTFMPPERSWVAVR